MKHNKLFNWLFSLFMLLPMIAIGVKCLYVSFNKNAYQSYYGTTENRIDYEQVTSLSDLEQNKEYIFSGSNVDVTGNNYSQGNTKIICSELTYNGVTYDDGTLSFYGNGNNIYVYYREIDSDSSNINGISAKTATLSFVYNSNSFTQDFSYVAQFITEVNYVNYAYLDNAFYYAIDEFNQCGFNKVDFVGWFDFFHTQNNIYIEFANTYINYMLFVTLAFFIPRVLMWFVGYAYGLTDSWSGRSKLW